MAMAMAIPVPANDGTVPSPYTCDLGAQLPTEDAPGMIDISCTANEPEEGRPDIAVQLVGPFEMVGPFATLDFTCSVALPVEGPLLDLSCTENEPYDFRVQPKGAESYGRLKFSVLAMSRPFGSILIDARVDCDDGTFYDPRDMPMADDSTDPLSVGEIGEVEYRVDECAGNWTKITLTPRFPEWRCFGCKAYERKRIEDASG